MRRKRIALLVFNIWFCVQAKTKCAIYWLGAQLGAIAILHTWDQHLKLHPHIHFIIPAGGITKDKKWKNSKTQGDFLFDVFQLSDVFRAIFVKSLRRLKRKGKISKAVPQDLYDKPWACPVTNENNQMKILNKLHFVTG